MILYSVFGENTPNRFQLAPPPKSHDLNLCDYFLWGVMDDFLQKMDHVPKTDIELRSRFCRLTRVLTKISLKWHALVYMIDVSYVLHKMVDGPSNV